MGKHSIEKREKVSGPSLSELRLRSAASQATSMTRRTGAIGAVTGGLLGLAFLPLAVAHADDWTVTPDSGSTETITGIYGSGFEGGDTAPPAVENSIQGDQVFDYSNATTGDSGTFYGLESYSNDGLGDLNTEVYVAPAPEGVDVSGAGAPAIGSVFDTYTFDDGEYSNVYSDVDGTVTDTLESPLYGNVVIPVTFGAANGSVADSGGVTDGISSDTINPVGSQTVDSISGIPPLTAALQGTQTFDVDNSSGTQLGTFNAVDTTTTDGFGTYTEAVLATSPSSDGSVGAGSMFNTVNLFGYDSIYSDVVGANGNTITETIESPLGSFTLPETFDGTAAETSSAMDIPNGTTLTPVGDLTITGVNGLPPVDVGVQGTQVFDFVNPGDVTGNVTADVTNTIDDFGDSTETVLITGATDPGAAAGSVFETVTFGDTGVESVYTDIVSATGDQITDTLVTPLGDFTIPQTFDAVSGLFGDFFAGSM